jgi:hypothetical protein
MRKRDSKRRWKARYRMGKWISAEAIQNHSLGALVAGGEWHHYAQMVRRP